MEKTELGLPLEYSILHKYFDPLGSDDGNAKNRVIEKILKNHKVQTVLDMTCGTGAQVFWLANQGYQVTGSDFSPALLEIARDKARQENIDIKLIDGDMRSLHVGHFDAVITIHNAVGHLTKPDFEKAMGNIRNNLKTGGLYVFDIFNLAAMTDAVVHDLAMDVTTTVDHTKITNTQHSKLDREKGRLTSYDTFSIQEGSTQPQIMTGTFTLQIYTAQELRDMLTRCGFETLEQYDMDGSIFVEDKTLAMMTIARKI